MAQEVKVPIKINPNKALIDQREIYSMIFYRGSKDSEDPKYKDTPSIAEEIVRLAARKKEHLHDSEYIDLCKKFDISAHEFQYIVRKLKKIGLLRKDGHIYSADRKFARYLRRLSMALQEHCDDLKIPLEDKK